MTGPPRAEQACRDAVRSCLLGEGLQRRHVLVACSGGPDSVALVLAASFVVPQLGGTVGAVVVDHRLQAGSAQVALRAAETCARLGMQPVSLESVHVEPGSSGPEDAARTARLDALQRVAEEQDASAVMLGHTRDDQAEQVLLGLVRGSGARSLSGIPPVRRLDGEPHRPGPGVLLLRPLLGVARATTAQACLKAGLDTWQDPHNEDPRYTRVQVRRILAELESGLGRDLRVPLARTAELLRADSEALDQVSEAAYRELGPLPWSVRAVLGHPVAVRTRLWRRLALEAGVPGADLGAVHLQAVDALVADWHGQGPVDLPGRRRVQRHQGSIWLHDRNKG